MALTTPSTRVELRPITEQDIPRVARFLHAELNQDVPADEWERAMRVPWPVESPNAGFVLLAGEDVVGANIAFYSEREIDGARERFCNLGAWCVLPDHRLHALRLLKALLAQDGYHFTDLSPSGNVVGLNERLGFTFLDTTTAVVPNLPRPSVPGRTRISSDPARIERTLTGRTLEVYRDHRETAAARHLVITRGDEHCYVIFRKDRRKGIPLFASILYVSHPELFRTALGPLTRHLLIRHGAAATLLERHVADARPRLAKTVDSPRRKMFRSASLDAARIDYLYSELVCLSW